MKWIFNKLKFRLFFITTIFLNTLALPWTGLAINPLYPFVFLWALILLIHDIRKKKIKYRPMKELLLYGIILLLVTILNSSYQSEHSILIAILQNIIILFIFFNEEKSYSQIQEEIKKIINWFCFLTFFSSFISIILFLFNVSITQNQTTIGMVGDRLFGVYFNCNPGSFVACISLLFSIWAWNKKYNRQYLFLTNGIIQILYVVLTRSRSALLILGVYGIIFTIKKYFIQSKGKIFTKSILSIVVLVTVIVSSSIVQKGLFIIPKLQGAVVQEESRFHLEDIQKVFYLIKADPIKNLEPVMQLIDHATSGRVELLYQSLGIWKRSPWIGIGAETFRNVGLTIYPNSNVLQAAQVVHAHNIFVEVLVTTGLIGFIFFFIFIIKVLIQVRRNYKNSDKVEKQFISFGMLIVLTEFIGGFFDYGVLYVYSVSATMCWLMLGYIYICNKKIN